MVLSFPCLWAAVDATQVTEITQQTSAGLAATCTLLAFWIHPALTLNKRSRWGVRCWWLPSWLQKAGLTDGYILVWSTTTKSCDVFGLLAVDVGHRPRNLGCSICDTLRTGWVCIRRCLHHHRNVGAPDCHGECNWRIDQHRMIWICLLYTSDAADE